MGYAIRIGISGDVEPAFCLYFATNAALHDAAARLRSVYVRTIARLVDDLDVETRHGSVSH